jgi:hypothetical protein
MSQTTLADQISSWLSGPWPWLAPQYLTQPINTGWTFGNVIVNGQNSSAPETELEIVSKDSYGRQIGKLLDAIHAMIEAQGGAKDIAAYKEVLELWNRVKEAKQKAAVARIDRLRRDLQLLRVTDQATFEEKVKELRVLLSEAGEHVGRDKQG